LDSGTINGFEEVEKMLFETKNQHFLKDRLLCGEEYEHSYKFLAQIMILMGDAAAKCPVSDPDKPR
jgi:hypothetical protein